MRDRFLQCDPSQKHLRFTAVCSRPSGAALIRRGQNALGPTRARNHRNMRRLLLWLGLCAAVLGDADTCSACEDVWLRIDPKTHAEARRTHQDLETSDLVSDECAGGGGGSGSSTGDWYIDDSTGEWSSQPETTSLASAAAPCANRVKIQQCYEAVSRACANCKPLLYRPGCAHDEEGTSPSFCAGHSATSAEEMSLGAWMRVIDWKHDHCTLPLISAAPYNGSAPLFKQDWWFPYTRQAAYERQPSSAGRRQLSSP